MEYFASCGVHRIPLVLEGYSFFLYSSSGMYASVGEKNQTVYFSLA